MNTTNATAQELHYEGVRHVEGIGVTVSYQKAAELFRRAAAMGCADSMHYLGKFYDSGMGLPSDERLMAEWMLKASEAGHSAAMWRLAGLYLHGKAGLKRSPEVAAKWYRKSAELGNVDSMWVLSEQCYQNRANPEAARQAAEWAKKAADGGFIPAMSTYGYFLMSGECGVTRDPSLSSKYLRQACRFQSEQAIGLLRQLNHRLLKGAGGVLTPEAQAATTDEVRSAILDFFFVGFWGDVLTTHEWDRNDRALANGGQILARYKINSEVVIEVTMLHVLGKSESYCISRYGEPEEPYRWDDFWRGFVMGM